MNGLWPGAAAIMAAGVSAWAVRGKASTFFGDSVYRGNRSRKRIALTFDDGPSESTPALLEILRRHHVTATFFVCGANVERCPDVSRQVVEMGHEIANHTYSHPRLDFKSGDFIYQEMARAQESIQHATGAAPVWFRAPYGVRWLGVGTAQQRLGLRGAMWTTMARDWKLPADRIAERLLRGAKPGAIFCLHDGRELQHKPDVNATLEAVGMVVPKLYDAGYEFVTLSQIVIG